MKMLTPFSAGTDAANTPLPKGACDCHIHVYDPSVAAVAGASLHPPVASISDYKKVQQRMGSRRAVLHERRAWIKLSVGYLVSPTGTEFLLSLKKGHFHEPRHRAQL